MPGSDLAQVARIALARLGERYRIPTHDAEVVGQHSNLAVALPSAGLLVRVAGNPEAFDRIAASVRVTRWLAARDFPCVAPADVEPFTVDGHAVTVWRLLDIVPLPRGSAAELGGLLRTLHDQPDPPFPVRDLTDPLAGVAAALDHHGHALHEHDRAWLNQRVRELREAWGDLEPARPVGLIHGDAHPNNLLRLSTGNGVLGDWDHTARGPREWDLIQPHYMRRRFRRHTEQELAEFTRAYGWDVRMWHGFDVLVQLREISGLSPYLRKAPAQNWASKEVAHRVATLRAGDADATWNSPPR